MDNVTSIEPAKQERKFSPGGLAKCVALAMNGKPAQDWPQFDQGRFVTVADLKGEKIIFQVDSNKVLRQVGKAAVDQAILLYLQNTLPFKGKWKLEKAPTTTDIGECRKWWLTFTKPIDQKSIKPVAFASEKGYAYHRLAFDQKWLDEWTLEERCPLFSELMDRTTNAEALMAWIGSLFDPKSPRQQYIWLTGRGGDGKGTLIRRLAKLMGPSFASEQTPGRSDRFWTCGLIGKRLVVFGDMDSAEFVTTGLFKGLTGEDQVRVEFKGGSTMSLVLPLKFLFSSNKVPTISLTPADQRRIILCEIAAPTELYKGDYEQALEKEMPDFISWCINRYDPYRGRPQIECDTQGALNVARQTTAEWDTIIEHHFSDTGDNESLVLSEDVENLLRYYYKGNKRDRDAMRSYLKEQCGISGRLPRIRPRPGAKQVRYYPGLFKKATVKPFDGID